jgi:hypothetical protein
VLVIVPVPLGPAPAVPDLQTVADAPISTRICGDGRPLVPTVGFDSNVKSEKTVPLQMRPGRTVPAGHAAKIGDRAIAKPPLHGAMQVTVLFLISALMPSRIKMAVPSAI